MKDELIKWLGGFTKEEWDIRNNVLGQEIQAANDAIKVLREENKGLLEAKARIENEWVELKKINTARANEVYQYDLANRQAMADLRAMEAKLVTSEETNEALAKNLRDQIAIVQAARDLLNGSAGRSVKWAKLDAVLNPKQ